MNAGRTGVCTRSFPFQRRVRRIKAPKHHFCEVLPIPPSAISVRLRLPGLFVLVILDFKYVSQAQMLYAHIGFDLRSSWVFMGSFTPQ